MIDDDLERNELLFFIIQIYKIWKYKVEGKWNIHNFENLFIIIYTELTPKLDLTKEWSTWDKTYNLQQRRLIDLKYN